MVKPKVCYSFDGHEGLDDFIPSGVSGVRNGSRVSSEHKSSSLRFSYRKDSFISVKIDIFIGSYYKPTVTP